MRRFILIGLVFLSTASALILTTISTAGQAATAAPTTAATDYKIVGFFVQWGMYARNYRAKQVKDTGSADKLTTINYAFANISTDSRCYEETRAGWGDASADYLVSYSADQSVNGLPDDPSQHLKGNFNQLKELKAQYPNLKVLA